MSGNNTKLVVRLMFLVLAFTAPIGLWSCSNQNVGADTVKPDIALAQFGLPTAETSTDTTSLADSVVAYDQAGKNITTKGSHQGTSYSYWQENYSCRKLSLTLGNCTLDLYDRDDNNEIGNDPSDYFRVTIGQSSIEYSRESVYQDNWTGDLMDREEALKWATRHFKAWRKVIIPKRFW